MVKPGMVTNQATNFKRIVTGVNLANESMSGYACSLAMSAHRVTLHLSTGQLVKFVCGFIKSFRVSLSSLVDDILIP